MLWIPSVDIEEMEGELAAPAGRGEVTVLQNTDISKNLAIRVAHSLAMTAKPIIQ